MNVLDLTQLQTGKEAKITEIAGGHRMLSKAESLGIRNGVKIKKISSQMMRGPITIEIGKSRVAIGFGMAQKIFVSTE